MKKIRIRGGSDWKEKCQTLCLAVSINSPKCSGKNFLAALDYAKNYGQDFFVDLSDTLHAPNIEAFGATHEEASAFSLLMGDKWMRELDYHLDGVRIIRWSEWYSHPDYQEVLDRFVWLYDNNETLQSIIQKDIECFNSRSNQRRGAEFFEASKNYALDECAGKTLQGRIYPGLAILYPGYELTCLSAVRDGLISSAPKGLENTRHIRYSIETRRSSKFPLVETPPVFMKSA